MATEKAESRKQTAESRKRRGASKWQ